MKKVLVVEDDPNISELIQIHLKDLGYEIQVRNNGKLGFEEANSNPYDLIILDIMLPEMDGLAVTESIRISNNEIPILILSAKNTSADRVSGLKKGADDYLTKPFNPEELDEVVKKNINPIHYAIEW